MDKSIIKVRSMSFKYADKYIFKDFDMDIDTNSFVCIIGRNASGKSTLVKILGGLCKASGYINVDGYLLNDTYIKKIRRSLAICFDDADRHFIGDTVFDDLAFSLENLGYFPKEIENMVNNIAKKFKIDDILDLPAEKINDSEKEKVMIASSLIFNPKILLLDESIHKLTPNDKKLVFKILDEYKRKEKLTIILITHDLEDTLKADRIIVLDNGNIVLDGTREEIYKDDTLEKMGFNLPFIVKLSHNLMLYDVLDKVYFDDVEVMKKLWG